jgi:hypothetical protein
MTFIDNIYLKKKIQELTEENSKLRRLIEMDVASTGETALSADVDSPSTPISTPRGLGGPTDTITPYDRESRRGEDDAQGFPQEWLEDFATMEDYLKELYGDPLPAEWQDFMQQIIERARQLFNQGLYFPFWRWMYPGLFL